MNQDTKALFFQSSADIQAMVLDDNFSGAIILAGQKAGIPDEQSLDVEDVAVSIMVGKLHPRQFIPTLTEQLGIAEQTATAIARNISEEIFSQIEDPLKNAYGVRGSITDAVMEIPREESEAAGVGKAPVPPNGGSPRAEQEKATRTPQPHPEPRPAPETLPGAAATPPSPAHAVHAPKPPIESKTPADASDEKTRPSDEGSGEASPEISTSIFEEKLKKASLPPQAQEESSSSPAQKPQEAEADPYRESIT